MGILKNCLALICATILFTQPSIADFYLDQVHSLREIHLALKVWHRYIKLALEKGFRKLSIPHMGTKQVFEKLVSNAQNFVRQMYNRLYEMLILFFFQKGSLVKRLSGTLIASVPHRCLPCDTRFRTVEQYWYFILNKQLSLNLTIAVIDFYFQNLNCSLGGLRIFSQDTKLFEFCGIYTIFNLYPDIQKISVQVTATVCYLSYIRGYFVPMDTNMIRTIKATKHHSSYPPVDSVLIVKIKTTVKFCLIKVEKTALVILHSLGSCEHSVHDGPDVFAEVVTLKNGFYEMSTFQSFVLIKDDGSCSCHLNFGKFVPNHEPLVVSDNKRVLLPVDALSLSAKMWIFSATAKDDHHLNATLVSLNVSQDFKSPYCRHGGFTVVENTTGNNFSEIITVCDNKSEISQSSNFYSSNSALTFVVFWYSEQVPIHSDLLLSRTKCDAVSMELCLNMDRRQFIQFYKWHRDIRPSALKLEDISRDFSHFIYGLDKNKAECAVLQLGPHRKNLVIERESYCSVWFEPSPVSVVAGEQVLLTVTGAVKRPPFHPIVGNMGTEFR